MSRTDSKKIVVYRGVSDIPLWYEDVQLYMEKAIFDKEKTCP
jgi:hypothetical protein